MPRTHKRILVTGADGFIGSHLTEALVRSGYNVRPFVLYNSFNSWGWLDRSPQEIRESLDIFAGDIRDPHGVREAMRGCDFVIHLAALIAIPYSYHSPDTYVDTNVKGTLNVVQAARELGIQKVLHTSTSEVYGTARTVPISEVALFCHEDRGGPDCTLLLACIFDAGCGDSSVQYVRTTAVGACCNSNNYHADCERQARHTSWLTATYARLLLCARYRQWFHRRSGV